MTDQTHKVEIFIAYAHHVKDIELKEAIKTRMAPLVRDGKLNIWDDHQINAGAEWAPTIESRLKLADIILLLASPDSLGSHYFNTREANIALERHEKNEALVIPVILRTCMWQKTPLAQLEALPLKGKPVNEWPDTDLALHDIATRLWFEVEKKYAFKQSGISKDPKPEYTGWPYGLWKNWPEWAKHFLAKRGLIEIHKPWDSSLYYYTKRREMLQKKSPDAWIHYTQMKIADADREKDMQLKWHYLALAWGLCETIIEKSEKSGFPGADNKLITALFDDVKNKFRKHEQLIEQQRIEASIVQSREYNARIDQKIADALGSHAFEDYYFVISLEDAMWFLEGSLWYYFGCKTHGFTDLVETGDLLELGTVFFKEYGIPFYTPVSGLLLDRVSRREIKIRPLKGQELPVNLGHFMFGSLIEFIQSLEKNQRGWTSWMSKKYNSQAILAGLEDLKNTKADIQYDEKPGV